MVQHPPSINVISITSVAVAAFIRLVSVRCVAELHIQIDIIRILPSFAWENTAMPAMSIALYRPVHVGCKDTFTLACGFEWSWAQTS
jgi:hypothetical protein